LQGGGGVICKKVGYHRIIDGGLGLQMCTNPHVYRIRCYWKSHYVIRPGIFVSQVWFLLFFVVVYGVP
jgi:hypothetical protein